MNEKKRRGRRFFWKMAAGNLRRSGRMYLPYVIAASILFAVYFMTMSVIFGQGISNMTYGRTIQTTFRLGSTVMTVFAACFMLYLNSFLIKRRKKEFGLYGILGLQRRHVGLLILMEGLMLHGVVFLAGTALGVLGGQGVFALLRWLLPTARKSVFTFEWRALGVTALVFGVLVLAGTLINLLRVRLSSPMDLLNGPKKGEKKSRLGPVMTVLGLLLLGWAYLTAATVTDAIAALLQFTLAVLAVIAGTYLLFLSGSVVLLERLQKRKKFYYQKRHFVAVSGLLHRMKQNAAGLATICILSTMVLVTVGCCVSLYSGQEEVLRRDCPDDLELEAGAMTAQERQALQDFILDTAEKEGLKETENIGYSASSGVFPFFLDGVILRQYDSWELESEAWETAISPSVMTAEDFADFTGKALSLEAGEALLLTRDVLPDTPERMETPAGTWRLTQPEEETRSISEMGRTEVLVLADESEVQRLFAPGEQERYEHTLFRFRFSGSDEAGAALVSRLSSGEEPLTERIWYYRDIWSLRQESFGLYGGLLFLGVFFAILFLTATVMIIYFKQISEGYEDKERFDILSKVGMDDRDIRGTINTQILLVFFLPLGTALVHLLAASNMLQRMMEIFELSNTVLTNTCLAVTAALFALVYLLVYRLTARTYYRIVR